MSIWASLTLLKVSLCICQSGLAKRFRNHYKHSIWTPTWPFLQVIYSILCLVYPPIACICACWLFFQSHFHTLGLVSPHLPTVKKELGGGGITSRRRWGFKKTQRGERHGQPHAPHEGFSLPRSLSLPLVAVDSLCSKRAYQNQQECFYLFVCMLGHTLCMHDWVGYRTLAV